MLRRLIFLCNVVRFRPRRSAAPPRSAILPELAAGRPPLLLRGKWKPRSGATLSRYRVLTHCLPPERSRQSLANQSPGTTGGQTEDGAALENKVATVEGRIQILESEGKDAHTIIEADEPSVCLIHVAIAFRDYPTGLKLHYAALTSTGEPETDKSNNPLVSPTGTGPEVHLNVFGTGFLASDD